jgi:single-stranded-DNA-specific exonuclease
MPRFIYDAEISFSELSLDFLASYELLQPFGNCNPQPIFVSRGVELCYPPFKMKNNHLRLSMKQGCHEKTAVFFGGGERDLPEPPWDIAFTIDRNTFRGNTSLQIVIQDIKASV